jgi:hypothetical protein
MNDVSEPRSVPAWYWLVAALALLFEAFGCYNYLTYVSVTPEQVATMPLDQQAVMSATPWWLTAAYGTAVWIGLAGALLLLFRRRHAELLLLISLVAVLIQFGGILLVPRLRDLSPTDSFGPAIVIALVAYGLWHFARLARKRGWLR